MKLLRAFALLLTAAGVVAAQCGPGEVIKPLGGGRISCANTSRVVLKDAAGNVNGVAFIGGTFTGSFIGNLTGNADTATSATTAATATLATNAGHATTADSATTAASATTAGTATALAADPADCAAGSATVGINASGAAQGCTTIPKQVNFTVQDPNVALTAMTWGGIWRAEYANAVVTQVACNADAASSVIMILNNGSNMLSGNLTCGNAAWLATTSFAAATINSGNNIGLQVISGTMKRISVSIKYTGN